MSDYQRWGSRPADVKRSRADFERDVLRWREHIAAKGYIDTPGGRLRVPVLLEQPKARRHA